MSSHIVRREKRVHGQLYSNAMSVQLSPMPQYKQSFFVRTKYKPCVFSRFFECGKYPLVISLYPIHSSSASNFYDAYVTCKQV